MRLSWTQAAAGALMTAVVAGLLILPGRVLGPDSGGQDAVALPAAASPQGYLFGQQRRPCGPR